MTSIRKVFAAFACLCLCSPAAGWSQVDEDPGVRSSIGFRAGYSVPLGEWAKNRVAPQVQQFAGNVAYEGDITIRLSRSWALALGGTYLPLNGSRWEEYAYSKGDVVGMSGSMTQLSLSIKPYLKASPPDLISFEAGAIGLFASGTETVDGEQFEYDFFSSFYLGFQAALEYDRLLSPGFALSLKAGVVMAPAGINYADGESRMIVYAPLTAGIRFLF